MDDGEIEKYQRIKVEREKAAEALRSEDEKEMKRNSAYLALGDAKVRGYTRDPNVVMRGAERLANISVILAMFSVVMGLLSVAAQMISIVNNLGMASAVIVGIPVAISGISGVVSLGLAVLALWGAIMYGKKSRFRVKNTVVAAIASIVIVGGYQLVKFLLL